jgi:uncharacterized protein YggE
MDEIKKIEFSDRVFWLSAILVLVVAFLVTGSIIYKFQSLPANSPQDFTISGTGKVYAKPDIALVSLGVKTEAIKSQDAVNKNNEKMTEIIKAVKELGIDEKDIQTTNYNLSPVYDWTERGGRVFKGYSLDQSISVKIRNFEKINSVLDKASEKGASTISDLQFTVDDMEKVRSEARIKAIADAKSKAKILAEQSGLKLRKLVNVSESNYYYPQPLYGKGGGAMESASSVAPDIQTGQLEINLSVYLTYKVR